MTRPAYPAAQAVATKARDHFAQHLAAAQREGLLDLASAPDQEAIELITDAAFWASLRREEGYPPKISLAFLPPEQATEALRFERPLRLTPDALTRLAPAVERPGIHLGVWRQATEGASSLAPSDGASAGSPEADGGSLVVWGATRTIPSYCFVLEVVAPGLLVIKHRTSEGAAKYVNVAVIEGDQVKVLDPRAVHVEDSPPLLKAVFGLDGPGESREPVNALLQLAVSMRAHSRGGSLLVVPAASATWWESIVRPIPYGVAPPFDGLGALMRENHDARKHRRWHDALRRAVDAVAGLTAVDGATIITDKFDLLAFGAKITRREGGGLVERVLCAEPLEGRASKIVTPQQLGGTRHISGRSVHAGPAWLDCSGGLTGRPVHHL